MNLNTCEKEGHRAKYRSLPKLIRRHHLDVKFAMFWLIKFNHYIKNIINAVLLRHINNNHTSNKRNL